jgi:hypothetical protein
VRSGPHRLIQSCLEHTVVTGYATGQLPRIAGERLSPISRHMSAN